MNKIIGMHFEKNGAILQNIHNFRLFFLFIFMQNVAFLQQKMQRLQNTVNKNADAPDRLEW